LKLLCPKSRPDEMSLSISIDPSPLNNCTKTPVAPMARTWFFRPAWVPGPKVPVALAPR
jgi:hypothetical protein